MTSTTLEIQRLQRVANHPCAPTSSRSNIYSTGGGRWRRSILVSRRGCCSTPQPLAKRCGGLYEGDLRTEVSEDRAQTGVKIAFRRLLVCVKHYVGVGLSELLQLIKEVLKHGYYLVDRAKVAAMVFAAPL